MIIDHYHDADMGREERLHILDREFGIRGEAIYLLDVIALIEMAWAHTRPGPPEYRLIYEYALRRVAEIDNETEGTYTMNPSQVNAFVQRYLNGRHPSGHLRRIRELAAPLMFNQSDTATNARQRQRLLDYCLDVGAASVGHYPYEAHERFGPEKKMLFREIAYSLNLLDHATSPDAGDSRPRSGAYA
jgi:hypothetical protein